MFTKNVLYPNYDKRTLKKVTNVRKSYKNAGKKTICCFLNAEKSDKKKTNIKSIAKGDKILLKNWVKKVKETAKK